LRGKDRGPSGENEEKETFGRKKVVEMTKEHYLSTKRKYRRKGRERKLYMEQIERRERRTLWGKEGGVFFGKGARQCRLGKKRGGGNAMSPAMPLEKEES